MAESGWWVSNNKISILLKKGWFSNVKVSLKWEEYPFTWLSSLYNSFNDLLDFFICNIAVCADDTTFYSKCDEAFDLLQQLELASELESDLWDTVDQNRKWLVDFNAWKSQLVSFELSSNTGVIDVNMGGFVLGEKSSFRMLGLTFSSKLNSGSYIISIAKAASKKIGALICFMKFFLQRLLCISIICHTALLGTLLSCLDWCSYLLLGIARSAARTDMLVLHLQPFLNPWFIIKCSYQNYFVGWSPQLAQLVLLPYSQGRPTCYSDRLHDFSVTISRCYKDIYVNSFFHYTARLCNYLAIECSPLTYDIAGFKSRFNRYLLTGDSF